MVSHCTLSSRVPTWSAEGRQDVVLHVQDARRVVRALDEGAQAARSRRCRCASSCRAARHARRRSPGAPDPSRRGRSRFSTGFGPTRTRHRQPCVVGGLPDLAGQGRADEARVLAGAAHHRQHARRIRGIPEQEVDHCVAVDLVVVEVVGVAHSRGGQDRRPLVVVLHPRQGDAETRPRSAARCSRFAPGSGTSRRGHRRSSRASRHPRTHVSLVPPPWLEFTTSEFSRRATRVRPAWRDVCTRSGRHQDERPQVDVAWCKPGFGEDRHRRQRQIVGCAM